jgi:hypothetical protein
MISILNLRMLKILAIAWISFIIAGISISIATPTVVVLIDRSYCNPEQWRQVALAYENIYLQDRQKQLQLDKVIIFSDLGQEELTSPPEPQKIAKLSTYGRPNLERRQALQQTYTGAKLLMCN